MSRIQKDPEGTAFAEVRPDAHPDTGFSRP